MRSVGVLARETALLPRATRSSVQQASQLVESAMRNTDEYIIERLREMEHSITYR